MVNIFIYNDAATHKDISVELHGAFRVTVVDSQGNKTDKVLP